MTHHIRPAIHNQAAFRTYCNDSITKGDAYMRYEKRDIFLNYSYRQFGEIGTTSLFMQDVSEAFKAGKACDAYRLEASGDDAVNILSGYLAAVGYNIEAFFDWCTSLEVDYDARGYNYVDTEQRITIWKRERKGVETFSPLALAHLKPLTEIPKKWTIPHVRRLLAAGQFSYCRIAQRYTSDYAHDSATNFGKGQCSGMNFLKILTESSDGWRVSRSDGGASDGDELAVWCHTFEKRVITIDLSASRRSLDLGEDVEQPNQALFVEHEHIAYKPAGVLMH